MTLISNLIRGSILILSFIAVLYYRKSNKDASLWAMITFVVTLGSL
jgi:hypothetical protein